jgi:polyribonucleotide nucleotidyltransferase
MYCTVLYLTIFFHILFYYINLFPIYTFYLGPGGSTVNAIRARTGASIDINTSGKGGHGFNGGGGGGTITISGPAESIQAAGEEITALLNPSEETIHCDINRARDVIGPGGATVKEIQAQTGARIDVNMSTL